MREVMNIIGSAVLAILITIGVIAILFRLSENSRIRTENACIQQYGQGWVGKYDPSGPNFCVNKDGEVKYPYER